MLYAELWGMRIEQSRAVQNDAATKALRGLQGEKSLKHFHSYY